MSSTTPKSPVTSTRVAALLVAALGLASAAVGPAQAAVPDGSRSWRSYVLCTASPQLFPVAVEARGDVSHPRAFLSGRGPATTVRTVAGRTPASLLLDFGKDVAGTPFRDVAAWSG